ncbi:MAG: fimbrillin family protein [Bacteroides sp.]|nr:fimbrillin family protein [Bacteroides sp.]
MNIKLYITGILTAGILMHTSCSDQIAGDNLAPGDEAVTLSGITTRANGDTYTNLHLRAIVDNDLTNIYIGETPITPQGGLYETQTTPLTFPGGTPYYPLGDNEIYLYAYTGQLEGTSNMRVRAGQSLDNDYLLSNYGTRSGYLSPTTEGEGTSGSAKNPAEILQFRHVMTQVEVAVEIDPDGNPGVVTEEPENIEIQLRNVVAQGVYNITNVAPTAGTETTVSVATGTSGTYTLRKGINYLVPNRSDLIQDDFTHLVIDDYTASQSDLANLQMDHLTGNTQAYLLPGYAYKITLLLRRLNVQSITIEQIEWNPHGVNPGEIGSDPYTLALDLGDYLNTGDDEIIKAVLWGDDGLQYVGQLNNGELEFVSLPKGGVSSVSLYTKLGLLLTGAPNSYTFDPVGSILYMQLSTAGMQLQNGSAANSESNPYLVYTPVQLMNLDKETGRFYRQMNDIDLDQLIYSESNTLGPIDSFDGIFDGNGYRLNNLYVTGTGLVHTNNGTIRNLHIDSGCLNATGENVAGSICAVNNGTLVACVNEARIIYAPAVAGGICGTNTAGGQIIGCVNTGNIEQGTILGGICGNNENPSANTFISCVNTGMLNRTDITYIGGIVGQSADAPGTDLIHYSFWLVGTAAPAFGATEYPTGNNANIGTVEVAALSPEKLRDTMQQGVNPDAQETLDLLNLGLQQTGWNTDYEYVLNQETTGSVWPIPRPITQF